MGMRLVTDNGLFHEFVPIEELGSTNPTRHWVATVEPEIDYAIVLTTCAGLWAYVIGDVVRFVDTRPPASWSPAAPPTCSPRSAST